MKHTFILLFLLTAVPDILSANTDIQTVLKHIERNNLTLKALRHEQKAGILDLKADNTPAGPSVEYSPFYRSGYSGIAESELIVSEEIEFPTKYAARSRQARLQHHANESLYQGARRDVLLQAQQLCFDIIRVGKTMEMLRKRLANSELLLKMFEKRMASGDANILEVNKVKLDCMDVLSLVAETEREHTSLMQQLQQLNGGEAITVEATDYPVFPDIADIGTMAAADADILAAEATLRVSEQEVSISRQTWLPNLTIGYRRNTEMEESANGVMVGVAFPLLARKSKVKAAKERRAYAELQLQQLQQATVSTMQARLDELRSLQRVIDHSDVEMMNQTLVLLGKALQHGEISALQYYTEINGIYEKLQAYINVQCQKAKLQAELHKNSL